MSVLFIALPIAILLGATGMIACVFCVRGGQYDDLETPAVRILVEDPAIEQPLVTIEEHHDGGEQPNQ